jgi:hypothetical protein
MKEFQGKIVFLCKFSFYIENTKETFGLYFIHSENRIQFPSWGPIRFQQKSPPLRTNWFHCQNITEPNDILRKIEKYVRINEYKIGYI